MSADEKLSPANIKDLFTTLFQEESAVVIVVDKQNQNEVLEYRIEPLAEVVATLAMNGLGTAIDLNPENQPSLEVNHKL